MRSLSIATLNLFLASSLYAHGGEDHSKATPEKQLESKPEKIEKIDKIKLEAIDRSYRKTLQPIFESKCYDCHSNKTDYPWYHSIPGIKQMINSHIEEGKEHIILSEGFPFQGHGSSSEDLEELKEVVEEETMPIWQYKLIHWNSGLTEKEKEIVLEWVKESSSILEID
ncbi:MAG: hypothetical protein COV44_07510 [Deltaproteobacteria bacterium CG11_big_fil_rev_8_21_14_0_20_45_16]|nr:MAG: hypothetical protein COV44_07510 [Deltaproteobacteria bacterium CG11_big_fil_rev_8_21_14_0_20_45_16]